MSFCDFCKSADTFAGICPNCGKYLFGNEKCRVISGITASSELATISLTNKYMFLNARSTAEKVATSTLGLLGIFLYAIFRPHNRYGFYDLREIERVIYPYRNKKLKNNMALKIVNKDGSDMIIKQVRGGIDMNRLVTYFQKAGVKIDSSCVEYGNVFCAAPFVDKKTMARRICPSAAGFVRQVKGNFVAKPICGVEKSTQTQFNIWKAETSTREQIGKKCYKCGAKLASDDLFCGKCGSRQ